MQRFEASPWSTSLKVVSGLGTVLLVAVTYALHRTLPRGSRAPFAEELGTILALVPGLILLVSILFVVKEYRLEAGRLHVGRLLWSTRVDLEGLDHAWHDPSAMTRSLRVFGNGGLFAITGLFQNATLGRYRAYVTDPKQAVVLRTPGRVVVVSPASPGGFLGGVAAVFPAVAAYPPGT